MREPPLQYVLDLPHRPALGGEDFWISECHAEVMAWLDAWPKWPASGVVVAGPPRAGKTHIARMFAQMSGAAVVSAAALGDVGARLPSHGARALVVEDIDRNPPEEALFHLFNRAREAGTSLLFTSRTLPPVIPLSLADWRSRLLTCPVAEIGRPDDRLMAVVLAKLFHDRQLVVGEAEIAFLLTHMERAIASAEATVAEADRRALALKRRVTVALLKETLDSL
ncbi:MAG: DNA replication protein [Rhodospirillaceae bacterium]|nr:DNA replication protein [Rhodospirillaceae bacterium]